MQHGSVEQHDMEHLDRHFDIRLAPRLEPMLLALVLAFVLALMLALSGCGASPEADDPVFSVLPGLSEDAGALPSDIDASPAALEQIGYRRMFIHDGSDFVYMPFHEAVQRAASVTVSQLESVEDTGEGYSVLTFRVRESLFNPDADTEIHLYERAGTGLPAYIVGNRYLLVLSRATNVYYPHPYFHNFNDIMISSDAEGRLTSALTSGTTPIAYDPPSGESLQNSIRFDAITDQVRALLADGEADRHVFRYAGYEIADTGYASLFAQSPVVVSAIPVRTAYRNRFISETLCRVTENHKGATTDEITVLLPAGVDAREGTALLLFLISDGEYRVTSRQSVITETDAQEWTAAMNGIRSAEASIQDPLDTPAPAPAPSLVARDRFSDLMERNPDVRGQIRIDGTVIDYPFLQSADNNHYLKTDIDGRDSVAACIVLDYRVDASNLTRNTPLYGHNMKRGSQFHALVDYKKSDFFYSHRLIALDTLYETSWWMVYSVSVVDSSYNYVITMDFQDDAQYRTFLEDTVSRSIWPVLTPPTVEDQIMTLVTCSYEFDGARTIIHAKRIASIGASP